jgi:hypothetical protein
MRKKQPPPPKTHEKRLPEVYNRKSTGKNKPTFFHIYYHFLSALVNNRPTPVPVWKSDLHSTMASWIEDGEGYLKCLENKHCVSNEYIQKELALFQQYLTPVTFGLAIHDIFFLEAHDNVPITKLYIKKRVAYSLHYENIKAFLIKRGHYNHRYEDASSSHMLPKIETKATPTASGKHDTIFFQFFQSILDSRADDKTQKILGSKLFAQTRRYVFSKQNQISESDLVPTTHHTTYQYLRDDLNLTMFGINMNRLLIKPGVAIKKLTNAGTVYIINFEKLHQHILDHTSKE